MPKTQRDLASIEQPEQSDYTDIEVAFRDSMIRDIEDARDARNQPWVEFDDMTYEEYRTSNLKARNAYLRPKVNKEDVRTTSGTTREKTNTLLAYLLNLNLEADIEAYDQEDNVVQELGTIMEDLIKKSYELELPEYDTKKLIIYDEFLSNGDVFVEDAFIEWETPDKELRSFDGSLEGTKWTEKMNKVYKYCSANLINGLNVYLGNIHEPYIENQPYIAIRRVISRAEAQSLYGDWERWKNVPWMIHRATNGDEDSQVYNDWTLESIERGYIEEIKYYNKYTNNFMIMLNGVMMFPVKIEEGRYSTVPLSSINGECEYPIAQGSFEKRPNFAYSTSVPAKTKVDQAIFDEMLKAIVLKTRKSYQPPMANNTGQALSRKIFFPSTITDNINPDKLQEIGENRGVTQAEFNASSFIKGIIDEKTISPIMSGDTSQKEMTAREVIELKQQSMMKAGLSILGIVTLEKRLKWLRLKNIIKNWTEPFDKRMQIVKDGLQTVNQYNKITVDSEFTEGQQGKRVVEFTENVPSNEQTLAEEDLFKAATGQNVRKNYINPKLLRNTKYIWKISIVPTEKDTGMLKAAKFEETVQKMLAMLLPLGKNINIDYVAERLAVLNGEDPDKLFPPQQQQAQQQIPGAPPGGAQGAVPNQMGAQLQPQQPQQPSVNAMAQA